MGKDRPGLSGSSATSLTVYPAAEIPLMVGQFAIINREKTSLDHQAVLCVRQSVGQTLRELAELKRSSPLTQL